MLPAPIFQFFVTGAKQFFFGLIIISSHDCVILYAAIPFPVYKQGLVVSRVPLQTPVQ